MVFKKVDVSVKRESDKLAIGTVAKAPGISSIQLKDIINVVQKKKVLDLLYQQ